MKTQHITLRENEALTALSIIAEMRVCDLIDKIITDLIENGIIEDEVDFCGLSLEYIFSQAERSLETFMECSIKRPFVEIKNLVYQLEIWGSSYECENCGCEVEYPGFNNSNYSKCTHCGYEHFDNAYDPDALRDDRCHYDLIETIHKN